MVAKVGNAAVAASYCVNLPEYDKQLEIYLHTPVGIVCVHVYSGAARLDLHTWTHFLLFWMSFARHSIASLSRASFKMVERFNWPSFGLFPSVAVYHVQQNGLLLWSTNKIFSTVFSGTQRTLVFLACNFHVQTSVWSFDSCLGSCTVDNLSPGDTVP